MNSLPLLVVHRSWSQSCAKDRFNNSRAELWRRSHVGGERRWQVAGATLGRQPRRAIAASSHTRTSPLFASPLHVLCRLSLISLDLSSFLSLYYPHWTPAYLLETPLTLPATSKIKRRPYLCLAPCDRKHGLHTPPPCAVFWPLLLHTKRMKTTPAPQTSFSLRSRYTAIDLQTALLVSTATSKIFSVTNSPIVQSPAASAHVQLVMEVKTARSRCVGHYHKARTDYRARVNIATVKRAGKASIVMSARPIRHVMPSCQRARVESATQMGC